MKIDQVYVEDRVQTILAVPNRPYQANGWSSSTHQDTHVDQAVTVCPIRVNYKEEWWQQTVMEPRDLVSVSSS